ncbi:lipid acyl hydrolase [Ilyonectria robusta]
MSTSDSSKLTPEPILRRADTIATRNKAKQHPWAPIVLSLDGGGIKGLSELFILLKIMNRIEELIVEGSNDETTAEEAVRSHQGRVADKKQEKKTTIRDDELFAFSKDPAILPCYFFDFMVGTSTGGLIAVMLGRLRMNVPDAIKAYWCLGNDIFLSRPIAGPYSSKKLKDAIIRVITDHCSCHELGQDCHDTEPLRQYDYAEENDISYKKTPHRQNFTCKVALVAQCKKKGSQRPYLFRSYNHSPRSEGDLLEHNPMTLGGKALHMWKACRATSAAPFYFESMAIGRDEFLDGGAGNNNPSNIAWNEAIWMSKPVNSQATATSGNETVAAVVSLGCGEKEKHHLFKDRPRGFYVLQALKYGRSRISDTELAHEETRRLAGTSDSYYARFSVKPTEGDRGNKGLADVKLSDCARVSKKHLWGYGPLKEVKKPVGDAELPLPEWYTALQKKATPKGPRRKKGTFKPEKFWYTTFDTIFRRTEEYCRLHNDGGENVKGDIDTCAKTLLSYARERQENDPERWKCHVSHPDPAHYAFLESTRRPKPREEEIGGGTP